MAGVQASRDWIRRHPIRMLAYATALAIFASVLFTFSSRDGGSLSWIVNQAFFQNRLKSFGLSCSVTTLRTGWIRGGVRPWLELAGFSCGLQQNQTGVRLQVDNGTICWNREATFAGIQIGTSELPGLVRITGFQLPLPVNLYRLVRVSVFDTSGQFFLQTEDLTGQLKPIQASLRSVTFLPIPPSGLPLMEMKALSTNQVQLSTGIETRLRVGNVAAEGIRIHISRSPTGDWDFSRIKASSDVVRELSTLSTVTLAESRQLFERIHKLLFWVLLITVGVLFILKYLSTPRLAQGWIRWGLLWSSVAMPLGFWAILRPIIPPVTLFLIGVLIGALQAFILFWRFYRRAVQWHQRWEPAAVDFISPLLLIPLLVAYQMVLHFPDMQALTLEVDRLSAKDNAGQVRAWGCDILNDSQSSIPSFLVENLQLKADLTDQKIRDFLMERVSLTGKVEIPAVEKALHRFQYLPSSWRQFPPPSFCAVFGIKSNGNPDVPSYGCPQLGPRTTDLEIRGQVVLSSTRQGPQYAIAIRSTSHLLTLEARVEGDLSKVKLSQFRSAGQSLVHIDHGRGGLILEPQLRGDLRLAGLRVPFNRFSAERVDLSITAPPPCEAGQLRLSARANGLDASQGPTLLLRAPHGRFSFFQDVGNLRGNLGVTAALENLSVESRRQAEPASWLKAEFPVAALNLQATKSPGWLPKQLEGRVQLGLGETRATALEIKDPLQFRADLWRGHLNLPQQRIMLHQEWIPQADSWIPLDLGADASLNSSTTAIVGQADLKVHVPNLQVSAGPVQLHLNDFNFRTGLAYGAGVTHSCFKFDSGLKRIVLSSLPADMQLSQVSKFQIDSSGEFSNVKLGSDGLKTFYQLLNGRTSLPSPEFSHITFWVSGGWPDSGNSSFVEVPGSHSNGIRLKGISGSINRFILEKAKITSIEGIASVSQIKTLRGEGTLAHNSSFSIMEEKGSFLSVLELGSNTAPLRSELSWDPSHLQFQQKKELELQGVLPALRPFLKQSGLDLESVELAGTIRELRASAYFSASRLIGVSSRLELGPDATAILDLPTLRNSKPSKPWPQVEFHFDSRRRDSGGLFEFQLAADSERSDRYDLDLSSGLRGFEAVAKTGRNPTQGLHLDSLASGRLSFKAGKEAGPTSILSEAISAGRGLWEQGQQASHILAPILAQSPELQNLSWRIRLGNLSPSEPLLLFNSNSAALKLKAEALDLQWKAVDSGQTSVLTSAISISTALHPFRRHLVNDTFLDSSGTFSWNSRPTHRWKVQLPIQIALIDELHPALGNPDLIWDSRFYEDFWIAYGQTFAEAHPLYLPNVQTIVLGPISLQQIQGPLFPIQLAVGYKDRLQLHLPLRSRILFGEASGIGQLSVLWQEPDVLIDSAVNIELQHLQARAAGLSVQGRHVPVIDDELDGRLKCRAHQFRLPPGIFRQSRFPFLQANLFKGFDIDFGLWKSTRAADLPGVLQLRTDTQLNLLNPVLNRIIRGWQFSYPPQRVPYQNMRFSLLVSDGRILPDPPLLVLNGVRLYSTGGLEFTSNVRLHWAGTKSAGDTGDSNIQGILAFVQRYLQAGGI